MTNGQFPLSGTSEPMTRQTGSTRSFLVRSTSLRRRYGAVGQRWMTSALRHQTDRDCQPHSCSSSSGISMGCLFWSPGI